MARYLTMIVASAALAFTAGAVVAGSAEKSWNNPDLGLSDPVASFKALEPHYRALQEMMGRYHPATPEYRALSHAVLTLEVAANLITGHLRFYDIGYGDTGHIGTGHRG